MISIEDRLRDFLERWRVLSLASESDVSALLSKCAQDLRELCPESDDSWNQVLAKLDTNVASALGQQKPRCKEEGVRIFRGTQRVDFRVEEDVNRWALLRELWNCILGRTPVQRWCEVTLQTPDVAATEAEFQVVVEVMEIGAGERPTGGSLQLELVGSGGLQDGESGEPFRKSETVTCGEVRRYSLRANNTGHAEVALRVYQAGLPRLAITGAIEVKAHIARSASKVERSGSLPFPQPKRKILALRLHATDSGTQHLNFELRLCSTDAAGPLQECTERIEREQESRLVGLCGTMKTDPALSGTNARPHLSGLGGQLAECLLGRALCAELGDEAHAEGTPLVVESDVPWIPWEILHVRGSGGERFLGEHFALSRWPYGRVVSTRLPRSPGAVVHGYGLDASARAEQAVLQEFMGETPSELRNFGEALARIKSHEPLGILHICAHGRSCWGAIEPFGGALLLEEGNLRQTDIAKFDPRDQRALAGAFVFLNGCETNLSGPTVAGRKSWADTVFEAGALAALAHSWSVEDQVAKELARQVYGKLGEGKTLPEALRLARNSVRRFGGVDWLACAAYCDPEAQFPIRVVGHDQLQFRIRDDSRTLLSSGWARMDAHVRDLLRSLRNKQPAISDELDVLIPLLNALTAVLGTFAQGGILKGQTNVGEDRFQAEVLKLLRMKLGEDVQEGPKQAGGITDIRYRGCIVELKVEDSISDRAKIFAKYTSQATQYQGVEARSVTILLVLDLTEKSEAPGDLRNDVLLEKVETHGGPGEHPSWAFMFVVRGNVKSPSSYSN